jgi:hypothetical protein
MENDINSPSASNKDIGMATRSNNENRIDKASASNTGKEIEAASASNVLKDLADGIARFKPGKCPEHCIYEVPRSLRSIEPKAYTPQVVSLGPAHCGHEELVSMEKQKLRYLAEFMDGKKVTLDDLVTIVQKNEMEIRGCYNFNRSSDDFVKMILLDAVFVIEFLLQFFNLFCEEVPILPEPRMVFGLQVDLILLENQLPYFILEKIYEKTYSDPETQASLTFPELVAFYFGHYYRISERPKVNSVGIKHFTDFLRYVMLNESLETLPRRPCTIKLKYSATMLHRAGLKFEATENSCVLDINFVNGVLKMPRFEVNQSFEYVTRNLMAYEQCHYPYSTYICNYFMLMDHLINTEEDVDLLVKVGVIDNWLGNNAMVADLINRLCEQISEFFTCYHDLCVDLNAYYDNRCNHRKATLKLVYFSNLWRGTGTVAAAVLLILTLIQTVCSIMSLLGPKQLI